MVVWMGWNDFWNDWLAPPFFNHQQYVAVPYKNLNDQNTSMISIVSALCHTNVDASNSLIGEKTKNSCILQGKSTKLVVEGQPECLAVILTMNGPLWWVGLVITHGSPPARCSFILSKPFSSSCFLLLPTQPIMTASFELLLYSRHHTRGFNTLSL